MKSPTFNLFLRYGFVSLFIMGVSLMAASKLLAQTPAQPLTVILVRHAEKEVVPPENKDPNLSMAGQTRAQELARMFGGAGVTSIYATQFKRTQQTVKPLAE